MNSQFLLDIFPAYIPVCLVFGSLLSVYLFLKGLRAKKEEYWERHLGCLKSNMTGVSRLSEIRALGIVDKTLKSTRTFSASSGNFLQSAPSPKTKIHKAAFIYRHLVSAWGLDPSKWKFFYYGGKIMGGLMSVLFLIIFFEQIYVANLGEIERSFLIVFVFVVGSILPEIFARNIVQKKRDQIEQLAPDFVDLLLLSVEAGMTFDTALTETKSSLKFYARNISRELEKLSAELVILPDRAEAFANLVQRTGSETFRYLCVALSQGEKYGTPIAASLRLVAQESRKRNLSELERLANRLPVLLSIPLMLLILPPVVVVSAGPGFVLLMRSFGGGG